MPGVILNFAETEAKLRELVIASGLPATRARPTLGAAIVVDRQTEEARVVPLVVIDFYRDPTE